MVWNLIMDSKTADFKWFKKHYISLVEFAKRHKITIAVMRSPDECARLQNGSILIVLGVDLQWLAEIEKRVEKKDVTVVVSIDCDLFKNNRLIKIHYDMASVVKKSVEYLKNKGRTSPACFGIQPGDYSDMTKAECFASVVKKESVYTIENGLENCFLSFYRDIDKYDSVICINDIMAFYLQKRCRELGISVPERLHVVGIGNLWLSAHTSPSITTYESEYENVSEVLWRIIGGKNGTAIYNFVDICLDPEMIKRESTGDVPEEKNSEFDKFYPIPENESRIDENICRIRDIDMVFSSLNELEINILKGISEQKSYQSIAFESYVSVDTVKYHTKKIYSRFGIHTKEELLKILKDYAIKL